MPAAAAVIVTGVFEFTADVVISKATRTAPAGTVTVAGTVTLLLLELKITTVPFGPAPPFRVTCPEQIEPPRALDGSTLIPVRDPVVTVRGAEKVPPPKVAVIVTDVEVGTTEVEIVNVPTFDPAETVTVVGTVAAALLDDKFTTIPPAGAIAESVTVPVAEAPPVTDCGATVTAVSSGMFKTRSIKPAQMTAPQPEAVSHPGVATETAPFGKVPLVPETTS